MSKWFGNIVTTLVILALTSVAAGLLKGPIDDLAAANRIQAQVEMSPWVPKVNFARLDDIPENDKERRADAWEDIFEEFRTVETKSLVSEGFGLLRINLENSSSKKVENVNFRLDGAYVDDDAIYIDAEGTAKPVKDVDRVTLPDMEPGDRIVVYIWGIFHPRLTPTIFKSYSSEGPFRVSFDWPDSRDFEYQSGIAWFIDEWAETVAIWAAVLLIAGLFISSAVTSEYYKNLLKNPEAYRKEHERFTEDQKNFQPDWAGVQTAASHLESVKKGLLPKGKADDETQDEEASTSTS